MTATSKDRIKLSIIAISCLLVLSAIGYMAFGNHKLSGMTTSAVKIVKKDNVEQINWFKKYCEIYAYKVKEKDEFYLNYNDYDDNSQPVSSKLILTNEQYNELTEDKDYWFDVKFSKLDDRSVGTIKAIYTENPMRN